MTAGVYCLRHSRRRLFYVGSSIDLEGRSRSWLTFFRRVEAGLPALPAYFAKAAAGTAAADWRFVVLQDLGLAVSFAELRAAERRECDRLTSEGCNLVNFSKVYPRQPFFVSAGD